MLVVQVLGRPSAVQTLGRLSVVGNKVNTQEACVCACAAEANTQRTAEARTSVRFERGIEEPPENLMQSPSLVPPDSVLLRRAREFLARAQFAPPRHDYSHDQLLEIQPAQSSAHDLFSRTLAVLLFGYASSYRRGP